MSSCGCNGNCNEPSWSIFETQEELESYEKSRWRTLYKKEDKTTKCPNCGCNLDESTSKTSPKYLTEE